MDSPREWNSNHHQRQQSRAGSVALRADEAANAEQATSFLFPEIADETRQRENAEQKAAGLARAKVATTNRVRYLDAHAASLARAAQACAPGADPFDFGYDDNCGYCVADLMHDRDDHERELIMASLDPVPTDPKPHMQPGYTAVSRGSLMVLPIDGDDCPEANRAVLHD